MFYSPLRYPGGKNKLSGFISKICMDNAIHGHYVEPYAGGASVALFLLLEGIVDRITINDMDRSIYALWHSILNETDKLCDLIEKTEITITNREKIKVAQNAKENCNLLELGFSTLFLNRTNRDGIIKGGVIGGKHQNGNYKLNCRFNKTEIIKKINLIASRKDNIDLFQLDALKLIDKICSESANLNTIFYFDPPYYLKGASLYMNYYKEDDHKKVAEKIKIIKNINWIVSYDNHQVIKDLYKPFKPKEYSFNHSVNTSKKGKEVLFFSENIKTPTEFEWNPIDFKYSNKSNSKRIQYAPSNPT